jgi:peptidase A4-like protein
LVYVRPRLLIAAVIAVAGLLGSAGSALANTQASSNWSGYAVHSDGVHFRDVSGEWRVPKVACHSGLASYSAMWVGLGGFSANAAGLEQTGTEADCAGYGQAVYSAWYELVPAASRTLSMTVGPGDLMRGEVKVNGRRVIMTLTDLSRRHSRFSHTFTPSVLDTTSAEWILEAPGSCSGASCMTLPLANFGRAAFVLARAVTTSARTGGILSSHWRTTRIVLSASGRSFVDGGAPSFNGGASPGGLSDAGSAFALSYVASSGQPIGPRTAVVASDRLRH